MITQHDAGIESYRAERLTNWLRLSPLTVLWALFAVAAGGCLMRWGHTGWPVGSFWWDELALAGGAEAIRQGLVPTVDYWAPFILPLYLKLQTENWVGHPAAYLVECLCEAGVVLLLFSMLVWRAKVATSIYWIAGLTVASVMAPFNIGSVTESQVGTVVNACSYNRFGGALIALVMMLPVVRANASRDRLLILWLGCVLAIAAMLKVTVFQITWCLVALWALFSAEGGWWRLLIGATGVGVLALLPISGHFHWWQGYVAALSSMSKIRLSLLKSHPGDYLDLLLNHRFELFALLFAALMLILRAQFLRAVWLGVVCWYLAACGSICAYMLTNFGDNGLMPALAALGGLLPLATRVGDQGACVSDEHIRYATLFQLSVRGIGLALGLLYAGALLYWTTSLLQQEASGVFVDPSTHSQWSSQYLFSERDWATGADLSVSGVPINYRNPAVYGSYLRGVDEAANYLAKNVPDKAASVYALDFPAYVFSMAGGYKVPKHTYPWLLLGHEITIDHRPDPKWLFSDVDVLMVPKCSISGANRTLLKAIYRVEIRDEFSQTASLHCWDVFRKKS